MLRRGMTEIVLIRHGHVEGIAPERFRGRSDLPLTGHGQIEAEKTGERVRSSWPDLSTIYTSPLVRAFDTGATIALGADLAVEPVPGFIDIDYGEWQGRTSEEVQAAWPEEFRRWRHAPHLVSIPAGETLQAVLARTSKALHGITRRHPHGTVAIVGHDCVNRVILLHMLDLPLSRYWRLKQEPCAISVIAFHDDAFLVKTINDSSHLRQIENSSCHKKA